MPAFTCHKKYKSSIDQMTVLRTVVISRFNEKSAHSRAQFQNLRGPLSDRQTVEHPETPSPPDQNPKGKMPPGPVLQALPIACPAPVIVKSETVTPKRNWFYRLINMDPQRK